MGANLWRANCDPDQLQRLNELKHRLRCHLEPTQGCVLAAEWHSRPRACEVGSSHEPAAPRPGPSAAETANGPRVAPLRLEPARAEDADRAENREGCADRLASQAARFM